MLKVYPLLDQKKKLKKISKWLSEKEEVKLVKPGKKIKNTDFDLCILDENSFHKNRDELKKLKEKSEPVQLPYLLLTQDKNPNKINPKIWREVDEIINWPVEKDIFMAIIEKLSKTRQNSIRLRTEEKEKDELLHSLLRHNLHNKLQIIQGYLELLEDLNLEDKVKKYVKEAKKGSDEGIDLIKKVRTVRETQEKGLKKVDLKSKINDGIKHIEKTTKKQGLKIDIKNIPKTKVKAGPLLSEVFSNILENIVRHSKGSKVKIRAKENKKEIICTIEDDGKGIPKKEKQKIFEKGYSSTKEKGKGLGLYLVKMLLENYNGNIEAQESELGGAKFKIRLQKTENS